MCVCVRAYVCFTITDLLPAAQRHHFLLSLGVPIRPRAASLDWYLHARASRLRRGGRVCGNVNDEC